MLRYLIALVCLAGSLWAQDDFYLHRGDRLLVYGSSARETRLDLAFLESYVSTRFPDQNISISYGSADRVPLLKNAGEWGRSVEMPTVLLLLLPQPSAGADTEKEAISQLQAVRELFPSVRLAAVRFGDQSMVSPGAKPVEIPAGITVWRLMGGLSLFPSETDGVLTAVQLLRLWHAPAVVTNVELDVSTGRVQAENTTVREVVPGRFVGWTQDEKALPLPLACTSRLSRFNNLVQSINLQKLRVTGLAESQYTLTIDGNRVRTFTRGELEDGVNLALLNTPMTRQADQLYTLIRNRESAATRQPGTEPIPLGDEARTHIRPRTHDYELQPLR
jgi:hypothetical protein